MILFNKNILFTLVVSSSLFAESSMFGAGDLESQSPYGLTTAEKVIVKNKKTLKANEKRIKKVDTKLDDLSQSIEALQSIFDGEGSKLNKVEKNFIKLNDDLSKYKIKQKESFDLTIRSLNDSVSTNLKTTNARLDNLQFQIDTNKENINLLKKSLDKAVDIVNDINKNYVSRSELKKELDTIVNLLDTKQKSTKVVSSKEKFSSKTKKQLMVEVRALFKKDYFTKALPILDYLIKNRYRPAECNYYKGEIKYYRAKYKDALHYFKTSMVLYDKAKYIPKLLLHSAISFEKIGDTNNAKNFYSTLIDVYPDSKEAKEASKKIK